MIIIAAGGGCGLPATAVTTPLTSSSTARSATSASASIALMVAFVPLCGYQILNLKSSNLAFIVLEEA